MPRARICEAEERVSAAAKSRHFQAADLRQRIQIPAVRRLARARRIAVRRRQQRAPTLFPSLKDGVAAL